MKGAVTDLATRWAIAGLIGLAAGLEREWSGHASGPAARFAGLRTFFLLGLLGGIAGVLANASRAELAAILLAGGIALSVVAYVMTVRREGTETDGTTEAAALVVMGLGVVAGLGSIGLAAGAGSIVVLMLREKKHLQWFVQRVDEIELRAALQFAVLAVVILPLLPSGPYLGALAVKPRALWATVLLFSALNFVAFVARRMAGVSRGLNIAGALGGIVSSTAVTLTFARRSRGDDEDGPALARAVIASCTVLVPRVLVVSVVLDPLVALRLVPLLAPPFVAGVLLAVVSRRGDRQPEHSIQTDDGNPLRLDVAIQMAAAFQASMIAVSFVRGLWGAPGLYATATVLGLTNMDALTASMSRPDARIAPAIAARAIAIGLLSTTILKGAIVAALGGTAFRRRALVGFAGLAAASAIGLLIVPV